MRISSDESLRPSRGIKIVLSTGSLSSATFEGAIEFTADHLSSEHLSLHSEGAGSIKLGGTVGDFTAELTGASDLQAEC